MRGKAGDSLLAQMSCGIDPGREESLEVDEFFQGVRGVASKLPRTSSAFNNPSSPDTRRHSDCH
ncbi:hypothetical protein PSCICE_09120 [Pseudomonas cichorii]|nr:hypothetical protein PSCICE_09120 [Pseudomonas cichorii]